MPAPPLGGGGDAGEGPSGAGGAGAGGAGAGGDRARKAVVSQLDRSVCLALGSGQVVTSLASAAKELVENALDAGSGSVELRLRGWGAEGMEVVDDGEGIPRESHRLLCRRNTTSKLSSMEDLERCATYGFRGEALSSLAAVAGGLTIVTRTGEDEVGSALEYGRTGELVSTESVARPAGTTVTLGELFKEMPVRRKDLMRNVKREYGRVLGVMQSIALIKHDVRIVVKSSPSAARPLAAAFATQGGSLRDNYACIFGAGSVANVEDVDIRLRACDVRLTGLVSRAAPGCGRSGRGRGSSAPWASWRCTSASSSASRPSRRRATRPRWSSTWRWHSGACARCSGTRRSWPSWCGRCSPPRLARRWTTSAGSGAP